MKDTEVTLEKPDGDENFPLWQNGSPRSAHNYGNLAESENAKSTTDKTAERVRAFLNGLPEKNSFGEKIRLVGAVKTQSPEAIAAACENGLLEIGENKIQELNQKLGLYPKNATLHFIGHLQTNKVKYAVGKVDLIQSVDSLHLASALDERAKKTGVTQKILLEINAGNDDNKFGFKPNEALNALREISALKNLKVLGFMAVLPSFFGEEHAQERLKRICLNARRLYDEARKEFPELHILSMGMTHDYQTALKCGSNMIRIGEALFGKRIYPERANAPASTKNNH